MKVSILIVNTVLVASIISGVALLPGGNALAMAQEAADSAGQPKDPKAALNDSALEDYTEEIKAHLVSFKMVAVPAGTVSFLDPLDPDKTVEQEVGPFWIAQTPVTWNVYGIYAFGLDGVAGVDYDAEARPTLARRGADYALDEGWGWDDRPAMGMTHQAAKSYAEWLSEKTGRKYRLPTEAEWIYACRAGEAGATPTAETLAKYAWFKENSDAKTHPVGKLKPNAFGIHDMLGNVAEWAVGADGQLVVLGGSFRTEGAKLSCTYRQPEDEDAWQGYQFPRSPWWYTDAPFVGIRVVCDSPKAD